MNDALFIAVVMGDAELLATRVKLASPGQLQRAMEAAVHWGDLACVRLLAPVCDIDAALFTAEGRNAQQPPGLQTTSQVLAELEAEKLRRDLGSAGAPDTPRHRL